MRKFLFITTLLFTWFSAFALDETSRQEAVVKNYYGSNGGFENGIKDISISGATKNWESTNKHTGNKAVRCSFDASAEYCQTKLVTVTGVAKNMEISFHYYTTATNLKAEVIDNSGNIVQVTNPLLANTGMKEKILEFTSNGSATYRLRFTSTSATAATLYFDDVIVSKNTGIGTTAQAEFVGSIEFSSNCSWSRNSTSFADYTGDASCTTTVVGNVATISDGTGIQPAVSVLYPKQGTYKVIGNFASLHADASLEAYARFYDGTNDYGQNYFYIGTNTQATLGLISGQYTYTSVPSTINIQLQQRILSSSANINAGNRISKVEVYRFPSAADQVVRAENANQYASASWEIPNANSNSVTSSTPTSINANWTKTKYGKAEDPSTANDIAVKITSMQPGVYTVDFNGPMRNVSDGSVNNSCHWGIGDGTINIMTTKSHRLISGPDTFNDSVSTEFKYDSVADRTFTLKAASSNTGTCLLGGSGTVTQHMTLTITPKIPIAPMPQIINSVGTSYNGQVRTERAKLNCDSGSAITSQLGSWISSIGNISSGACAVTITSGIFNTTPDCKCLDQSSSLDSFTKGNATSTTAASIIGTKPSDGTALTSFDCIFECHEGR